MYFNDIEVERIHPGEEGYEEAQEDLVSSCPDNRPFSLTEARQMIDDDIELFDLQKVNYDFDPEAEDPYEPAADFIARQKKLRIEIEQAIAQAEAQEPGSSEPPIPTEEEKKFYQPMDVEEDK